MSFKISDYPELTAIQSGDYLDVSEDLGASTYETKKLSYDNFLSTLNSEIVNIYNSDGSLTEDRDVDTAGFDLAFTGLGTSGVGINTELVDIGAKLTITAENVSETILELLDSSSLNVFSIIETGEIIGKQIGTDNTDFNTYLGYRSLNDLASGTLNSSFGKDSGRSTTIGIENSFFGAGAGASNVSSSYNSYFGKSSGQNVTGEKNTAIGYYSLHTTGTGSRNTTLGYQSGYSIGDGTDNIMIGYQAGYWAGVYDNLLIIANTNTTQPLLYGDFNNSYLGINWDKDNPISAVLSVQGKGTTSGTSSVKIYDNNVVPSLLWNFRDDKVTIVNGQIQMQYGAFTSIVIGTANTGLAENRNTSVGVLAGQSMTNQFDNTYIGYDAGSGSTGRYSVALGSGAGKNGAADRFVTIGYQAGGGSTPNLLSSVLIGPEAGKNATSHSNVIIGDNAGKVANNANCIIGVAAGDQTTGNQNVVMGYLALGGAGDSRFNTVIGSQAGAGITEGDNNTLLGNLAGNDITTGSFNVILGNAAGDGWITTQSNLLVIENSASSTPLIYGEFANDYLGINIDTLTKTLKSTLTVGGDIEVGSTDAFYWGEPDVDTSWRAVRSGDDLLFQQREAGVWNTKQTISGA